MNVIKYKTALSCKIKEISPVEGIVSIYVNAFNNVDADGDISVKGSFKNTIKQDFNRIKHFKNHDWDDTIGLPIEIIEDDFGLLVVSKLNLEKGKAKDLFSDYQFANSLSRTVEHSIGGVPIISEFDKGKDANIIKEWKLYEYSTVPFGANKNTPTVSIKNFKEFGVFKSLEFYLSSVASDVRKKEIEKLLNFLTKENLSDLSNIDINKLNFKF